MRRLTMTTRRGWYRITNAASGPARVDIYDEIGDAGFLGGVTAQDFVAELADVKGDLEVHINSPGGNVFDGLAIYNALASRPGKVTTVVDGLAASAASFIAQAGRTRVISPGAMVMIHDAMGLTVGNAADMRETADLLDKASGNIADLYAAHSGRPVDGWRDAMRAETWYTAQEAVNAGLADRLAERPASEGDLKIAASFDLRGVTANIPDWARARNATAWDPDGDGDDDSTPEGDTDHDYWSADGRQLQPVPGKPMNAASTEVRNADKYNTDDRKRMASSGEAMPDGSYPIADEEDLHNAIHAVGRGGSEHDAIRRHIISRARAIGHADAIPDNWNPDGSLKTGADNHLDPVFSLSPEMHHNLLEALKGAAK